MPFEARKTKFTVFSFNHELYNLIKGLVHFADPQSMDYPIWTTKWTTLMDSQMDYLDGLPINYPRKRKERNITPSLFPLIELAFVMMEFNDSKSYILKLFFPLCFLAFSFSPKSHKNQIFPQY